MTPFTLTEDHRGSQWDTNEILAGGSCWTSLIIAKEMNLLLVELQGGEQKIQVSMSFTEITVNWTGFVLILTYYYGIPFRSRVLDMFRRTSMPILCR
jgi:hypothetical protein